MTILPGLGPAVPIERVAVGARRLAVALERVATGLPGAVAVRNRTGNLSIVTDVGGGQTLYHGWIDVLTGDVDMLDAPWRTAGD